MVGVPVLQTLVAPLRENVAPLFWPLLLASVLPLKLYPDSLFQLLIRHNFRRTGDGASVAYKMDADAAAGERRSQLETPPLMTVAPLYVLGAVSVKMPRACLARPPAPLKFPL